MTARGVTESERAYSIASAAAVKDVSPDTIRAAIHATTGAVLVAKKVGNRYRISASALDRWFDSLEDA